MAKGIPSRFLVLALCAVLPTLPATAGTLGPGLAEVIEAAAPGDLIPVSIVLAEQPRLSPGTPRVEAAARLRTHAARTQAPLLARLGEAGKGASAAGITPLWLGNAIGAALTPALIREVAARPEVARVNWNPPRPVFLGSGDTPTACGVNRVRAPRVWSELGRTGTGAVVAVIDSGACYTHPDIAGRIWVNPGEDRDGDRTVMDPDDVNGTDDDGNGFVDDLIGWDFDTNDRDPNDTDGHGSHVAGIVAGDGTGGWQTGVAPGAALMILRVGGTFADEVDVWSAMQYALDNGAQVVSMSLGWPHDQNPDRAQWRTLVANLTAAGVTVVVAAGNEGDRPPPDGIRTPADVPEAIAVGMADCFDLMAYYSSKGPVTWQDVAPFNDWPYPPGLTKPDLAAPGVATRSLNRCSGYIDMEGTSMAAPHVSGAVALMLSQQPDLEPAAVKAILEDTALDLLEPGKDNHAGAGRLDAYRAVLATASRDGQVAVVEDFVSCAFQMLVQVADLDLAGSGPVTVTLASETEPGGETLALAESALPGVFRALVPTAAGPSAADGVLQVAHGDTVTVTYLDEDDGAGGENIVKTDTAAVDCVPPVITNVREFDVWTTQAWIRWDTDEPAAGSIDFGAAPPLDRQSRNDEFDTMTQVHLIPLVPCTRYLYAVTARDRAGNVTVADNGGALFDFESKGSFGLGMQNCGEGKVAIDADTFICGSAVTFKLADHDLNGDPAAAESVVVLASSATEPAGEPVSATETGPDTSLFTGAIPLAAGPAAPDGVLQAGDGETLTVTYADADRGTGVPGTAFDSARTDCLGPRISNLRVDSITNARGWVRLDTNEQARTEVDFGPTPALGQTVSHPYPVFSRSLLLNQADTCQQVYFRVRATDNLGSTTTVDENGQPFRFVTGNIPGLYWRETFEGASTGWTLQGEWEFASPQGLGGSTGAYRDPERAYNNLKALGTDLTGRGVYPGDFEPGVNESAFTPFLDAGAWRHTKLIVHKSANVGPGDQAILNLRSGAVIPLFDSGVDGWYDFEVAAASWDVSAAVDGRKNVRLQFQLRSNATQQYCGFNIDDVIFKDGTLPDFAPCGGCGVPPSFAGAVSAADGAACAPGGVTVRWERAPAWGTADAGTYAIYRGAAPGFPADAAHRVAYGSTGTVWTDPSPPPGTSYYLVRAENAENCGSGAPANGGLTDANTRYLAATETSTQPLPAEVTGLTLALRGGAHIRLEWPPVPGAASYRTLRAPSPQPGAFSTLATTAAPLHEDLDQALNSTTWFYLVRALNPCNQEGP